MCNQTKLLCANRVSVSECVCFSVHVGTSVIRVIRQFFSTASQQLPIPKSFVSPPLCAIRIQGGGSNATRGWSTIPPPPPPEPPNSWHTDDEAEQRFPSSPHIQSAHSDIQTVNFHCLFVSACSVPVHIYKRQSVLRQKSRQNIAPDKHSGVRIRRFFVGKVRTNIWSERILLSRVVGDWVGRIYI